MLRTRWWARWYSCGRSSTAATNRSTGWKQPSCLSARHEKINSEFGTLPGLAGQEICCMDALKAHAEPQRGHVSLGYIRVSTSRPWTPVECSVGPLGRRRPRGNRRGARTFQRLVSAATSGRAPHPRAEGRQSPEPARKSVEVTRPACPLAHRPAFWKVSSPWSSRSRPFSYSAVSERRLRYAGVGT